VKKGEKKKPPTKITLNSQKVEWERHHQNFLIFFQNNVPNQPNLARHFGSYEALTPGKHPSVRVLDWLWQAYYSPERKADTLL